MTMGLIVQVPSAPVVTVLGSEMMTVAPGPDDNGEDVEYAIFDDLSGLWAGETDTWGVQKTWQPRDLWTGRVFSGFSPGQAFSIRAQALDSFGMESCYGPASNGVMDYAGESAISLMLGVVKAPSGIEPPPFMEGLPVSVRIAGKSLDDFGFHVDRIGGLDLPKAVGDEVFVPGDHSWQAGNEYLAVKRIVIEGYMHGESPDGLRARIAYLKSFLATFEGSPWRSRVPIRLERTDLGDRHWNVFYESLDLVDTVGKRDLAASARVRITLKSLLPFALSNGVVRASFTPAAGGFHTLALGNAPSDAVYTIAGPAVNPSFSVGDMVFHCDFSDGLTYTGAENAACSGTFTPSSAEHSAYRPSETGMGLLVTTGNTVEYTATGNPADGAWVAAFEPRWSSAERTTDAVILEHRADADNLVRLFWDASAGAWAFLKRAGGAETTLCSPVQAFETGTRIVLGAAWDASHLGGMALFIDGETAAAGNDTAALSSAPQTVTLHDSAAANQPDVVFGLVAGWARMLSGDEMRRIAGDPTAVSNRNVTVTWTGTLSAGDFLILDSRERTAVRYVAATGARENALGAVSGDIPVLAPGRRRTASADTMTTVFTHTAAGSMEVRYRKAYL